MPFSTLIDRASDKVQDLAANLFSKTRFRKITDINKESKKLSLELYGVYSSNISPQTMMAVQKLMAAKYTSSVASVLKLLVHQINEARQNGQKVDTVGTVHRVLANSGETNNNAIQSVADRVNFAENVVFNKSTLSSTAKVLSEAGNNNAGLGDAVAGTRMDFDINIEIPVRDDAGKIVREPAYDEDGNVIKRNGNIVYNNVVIPDNLKFDVLTTVNMVPVEAPKLVETIGTTKDRSILFNYIKLRAGNSSPLQGFLMNLKEIDKEVQRNVSDSMEDRILASMMKKGGFLIPDYFSELTESRHYVMCIEKSDADMLRSNYGFDLRKPNALRTLFDRYKILSLVIVDSVSKNLIIHDSDNPLTGVTINYDKSMDNNEALDTFMKLVRN